MDKDSSFTGTHSFAVTNYLPALDGMGTGKFVSSSAFRVGGCQWRIDFYPDGNVAQCGDCASAFLYLLRGTAGVSVTFTLSVLGDKDQLVKQQTTTTTFEFVCAGWGWPKFVEKSKLEELLDLTGGRFTIECVLTVKKKRRRTEGNAGATATAAAAAAAAAVVVPQPKLQQDLADMLKSGQGADVTFIVGDRFFPAHRCILAARSAVFKAELYGTMKEKDAQRIEVEGMEPAVFEALLHFVYADSLPDGYGLDSNPADKDAADSLPDDAGRYCGDNDDDADENVAMQRLLDAADRYGLDRLRLLCEAKLSRGVDVQTVATTLHLAEQHHCAQLKGACLGFIASPGVLGAVMETDGFKHLAASYPLIVKEILDNVAAVWSK